MTHCAWCCIVCRRSLCSNVLDTILVFPHHRQNCSYMASCRKEFKRISTESSPMSPPTIQSDEGLYSTELENFRKYRRILFQPIPDPSDSARYIEALEGFLGQTLSLIGSSLSRRSRARQFWNQSRIARARPIFCRNGTLSCHLDGSYSRGTQTNAG